MIEEEEKEPAGALSTGSSRHISERTPSPSHPMRIEEVISTLMQTVPVHLDPHGQRAFLLEILDAYRSLDRLFSEELLVPVSELTIQPGSEVPLFLHLNIDPLHSSWLSQKLMRMHHTIHIEVVQCDASFDEIVPIRLRKRALSLEASICRSQLDVSQQHLNFGTMYLGESSEKSILVVNASELPLLYKLGHSGSIASGDLQFHEDKYGILRPYGSREIHFRYKPSLPGVFHEKITIVNVLDDSSSVALNVKSNVLKRNKFTVECPELSFGTVELNDPSEVYQQITLSNTSEKRRTFELVSNSDLVPVPVPASSSPQEPSHVASSILLFRPEQSMGSLTMEKREQIDKLIRSIRIAERKGKIEKAEKLRRELEELRAKYAAEGDPAPGGLQEAESERTFTFSLDPKSVQVISVRFKALVASTSALSAGLSADIALSGSLMIYESNDRDSCKTFPFSGSLKLVDFRPAKPDAATLNSKAHTPDAAAKVPAAPPSPTKILPPPGALGSLSGAPGPYGVTASPTGLELGYLPILQAVESSFTLTNPSLTERRFVLLAASLPDQLSDPKKRRSSSPSTLSSTLSSSPTNLFVFPHPTGTIPARGSTRVPFVVCPQVLGQQTHVVLARLLDHSSQVITVEVSFNGAPTAALTFPDLARSASSAGWILDIGPIYWQPVEGFSKTVPLKVQNQLRQRVFISCSSNLAKRISFFADSSLATPAKSIQLPPLGTVTVFVVVTPDPRPSLYADGVCRELLGGLQFRVAESDDGPLLGEETVRLTAIVGRSLLFVSSPIIDLGQTARLGLTHQGTFVLENRSSKLPLKFSITSPTGLEVSVSPTSGMLSPCSEPGIDTSSQVVVQCHMKGTAYGLSEGIVTVRNLEYPSSSPDSSITVRLRLFVDDGSLRSSPTSTVPTIRFDNIYVLEATDSHFAILDPATGDSFP